LLDDSTRRPSRHSRPTNRRLGQLVVRVMCSVRPGKGLVIGPFLAHLQSNLEYSLLSYSNLAANSLQPAHLLSSLGTAPAVLDSYPDCRRLQHPGLLKIGIPNSAIGILVL
jgi:hypothetical protein